VRAFVCRYPRDTPYRARLAAQKLAGVSRDLDARRGFQRARAMKIGVARPPQAAKGLLCAPVRAFVCRYPRDTPCPARVDAHELDLRRGNAPQPRAPAASYGSSMDEPA
jgi:hypothetical protein